MKTRSINKVVAVLLCFALLLPNFTGLVTAVDSTVAGAIAPQSVQTNTSDQCGLPYFNWVIFMNELQGCTKIVSTGVMDGICYHPPTEQTNLFTS